MKNSYKILGLLLALGLSRVPMASADCGGKECASKKHKKSCNCEKDKKSQDKSGAEPEEKTK